ncbi:MAG: hypothetical protein AB7V40_01205 [Methyloceanibacter sp.]
MKMIGARLRRAGAAVVSRWHRWRQKRRVRRYAFRGKRRSSSERISHALETATLAEIERDVAKMHGWSYRLIRLELYEQAWELRIRAAALQEPYSLPEWSGDDLSGRTILVRGYVPENRIGEELRMSRFIPFVSERARRCIVLTEKRLVPLLSRSFPGVDVRARGADDEAAMAEADVAAYWETIALHCAKNAEELRRSFVPLRADPTRTASIRHRYKRKAPGPLIGISWSSINQSKILPGLFDWTPLLGWPAATFVSLQYGNIERDLAVLGELTGGRIIHDPDIDQLVDLDGFAAQIAALDAVVSISNTTIDMAGMLGGPTVHIRGDRAAQIWPRSGASPWYPDMMSVYKKYRPWPEVFAETRIRLEQVLSEPVRPGPRA